MKIFKHIGLIVFLLSFGFATGGCAQEAVEKYDVVIYGGTFAGCAAARTAAQLAPESSILVIVPAPEHVLGGIGTAGGQNFFDVRLWRGELVTAGSFARWYREAGQFYNTQKMAQILSADLARHKNITILWGYDVMEVQKKLAGGGFASRIKRLPDLSGMKRLPALSGFKGWASLSGKEAGPPLKNGLSPESGLLQENSLPPEKGFLPEGSQPLKNGLPSQTNLLQQTSLPLETRLSPETSLPPQTGPDLRKEFLPFRITTLRLREVCRDDDGVIAWGKRLWKITGRVFIDASDDGRLTRLAGGSVTVGRGDWSDVYLPPDERGGESGLARQQAATLLFKVSNVVLPGTPRQIGDLFFQKDPSGGWGIVGGSDTFCSNPVVVAFNDRFAPRGFALKPLNAAQDGAGSGQWWVNALLVFNVDGRACRRDLGSERYPEDKRSDAIDRDEAWLRAREFLERPGFIEALRQFTVTDEQGRRYGFHRAELVRSDDGRPVVADELYLRETIHLQRIHPQRNPVDARPAAERGEKSPPGSGTRWQSGKSSTASGTDSVRGVLDQTPGGLQKSRENSSYALTPGECRFAGTGPGAGADWGNYATRIGLGYYLMDINAYTPADLKQNGVYRWAVTDRIRPDLDTRGSQPQNPVYLPFEMLVTPQLVNLLVPGYATGAGSLAWAEIRVIPNLCVLGDAAGAAAAGAVLSGEDPACFQPSHIKWVQHALCKIGARLDK